MNFKEALNFGGRELAEAKIPSAILDTQILLEFATGNSRTFMLSHPESHLTKTQELKFKKLIKRRQKYEPIAYITGHKEFFGIDFQVDKNVLIPRPESEELINLALRWAKGKVFSIPSQNMKMPNTKILNTKYSIIDLGTGSGCLIISLVKKLNELYGLTTLQTFDFCATDISQKALNVAKKNAKQHDVKINFLKSDLLSNMKLPAKFDLIIANLPYVPGSDRIMGIVSGITEEKIHNTKYVIHNPINFEPQNAIFADDNGTALIKKFLVEASGRLNPNGLILIELDPRNANELLDFAKTYFRNVELKKDLAGLDRYLIIK